MTKEELEQYRRSARFTVVHRGRTFWAEYAENEWLCGLMVLEPTLWQPLPDSPEGGKE